MKMWWAIIGITGITCMICCINFKEKDFHKKIFFSFLTLMLILISGLRLPKGPGTYGDTGNYTYMFVNSPIIFKYNFSKISDIKGDWGLSILNSIIKCFTNNEQVYLIVIASITLIAFSIILYKYSRVQWLAFYIFVASGAYVNTFNGIRQYMVSAIAILAFTLIYKKKWIKYFALILLLSTIHASVIVFIPLYFIVNKKAWGKCTKLIILSAIIIYITFPITGKFITSILEVTQYYKYADDLFDQANLGANFIRVMVASVPVLLSYFAREEIINNEKYANIITNMTALNFSFMLLANKNWIFARLNIYTEIFSIIALCWSLKYLFKGKEKRLLYYTCILCYTIFYFYQTYFSVGKLYVSYYLNL